MSSSSVVEAGPLSNKVSSASAPTGRSPSVLAVGSALLLWTTFPPADWSWFAWFALVPLFLTIGSKRSARSVYFGVWLGGMIFWSLSIQWVRLTDPTAWLAWLAMSLALSAFWPAFVALTRLSVRRLRLPLMIAAPVIWVALEYVRAYAVTGFPWYYLAHSQHAVLPIIQVSDITGSLGVSLLIAVVNAWIVDVLTLPLLRPTQDGVRLTAPQALRLGVVAIMVSLTLGYGVFRVSTARFKAGPRVALLQSNFEQRYKESSRTEGQQAAIYTNMAIRASRTEPKPDLIVWPETSYPYGYVAIDPKLSEADLDIQVKQLSPKLNAAQWLQKRDDIATDLHTWTDHLGVSMLVGSLTYDHRADGQSKYNSAILFQPKVKSVQSFHKIHLVPFGEYVPLIETFPWLVALTPYNGSHVPSLSFGVEPTWMDLGPYRLATAICFEDTVPHVVRRLFNETKDGRHPDVLLNLSNDGWFHGSSEHDMHLAVSIFRAVENRVPLARAVNTGVSAIIDGNGRVLKSLPKLVEDVLIAEIPLDGRAALYSSWGDWLGLSCLAITIGLVPLAIFRPSRARITV